MSKKKDKTKKRAKADPAAGTPFEGWDFMQLREYKTSSGLTWSTNFPPGSLRFEDEKAFAEIVDRMQELGFGRMRQMIYQMWNDWNKQRGLPPNEPRVDD